MKTAPIARGHSKELSITAPVSGARLLLALLRGGLFLGSGLCSFLRCVLHRLILPKHQICDQQRSQCDSYIELIAKNVKKKVTVAHRLLRCRVAKTFCPLFVLPIRTRFRVSRRCVW
jgi:hypothetical protein